MWASAFGLLLLASSADAAPALAPGVTLKLVEPILRADLATQAGARSAGPDWTAVVQFYQARGFRPAWIANPSTDDALTALKNSAADGLEPEVFHYPWLAAQNSLNTAAKAANYDLTLTASLLRYAHELRRGVVNPERIDKMVGIVRPGFDPASTLATALNQHDLEDWLTTLPPAHPEYAKLKDSLAHYREMVANGGWPQVPDVGSIELKAGNPDVAALERRLAVTDSQLAAASPADLDIVEAAVRRFQARNGLVVDGVVGKKTIAALNVSAAERVSQIEANMERWRWLPHRFPPRYVEVNAAAATLKAVDGGSAVLSSRVITGKPRTPTAIFNAHAVALTINPPWIVPASIARNEIMPMVHRNPAYLSKHHMIIVNGQVRQLPGADNALGYLKVEMPNPFTAYLHDTSSRGLFGRDERHLSHGCIRVQKILPLASWLHTGSVAKGLDRIDAAIAAGTTQKVSLETPVEIFVLYWTAIPRDDGDVDFWPDVYGRDKKLIPALARQSKRDAASLGAKIDTDRSTSETGASDKL